EIRSGGGPLPTKTLKSVWATLKEREQVVLRAMAETVKPDSESDISEYLSGTLNFNRLIKALTALRALNLVVIKRRPGGDDLLELHPLVRQFVRNTFPQTERISYIDGIIRAYKRFIGKHKSRLAERPALSILQYWTQNADLDVTAGRFEDAFITLSEVSPAFRAGAYPREFTRAGRNLLRSVNWTSEHNKYIGFETVFNTQITILSDLGEYHEVDALLEQYELIVPERDARYIAYCDRRCYSLWVRGDFSEAVRWGKVGENL